MSAASAAARGRAAAERLMTDACQIRTPPILRFNPTTKANDIIGGDELVYAGVCRIRPRDVQESEREAGDSPVSTWAYVVSIPFGAQHNGTPYLPAVDQVVTVTASADPTLVGQRLRARQVIQGTHITARRMVCEVYGG